jgi:hypothetical protein
MLTRWIRVSLVSIAVTAIGLPVSAAVWVGLALLGY